MSSHFRAGDNILIITLALDKNVKQLENGLTDGLNFLHRSTKLKIKTKFSLTNSMQYMFGSYEKLSTVWNAP